MTRMKYILSCILFVFMSAGMHTYAQIGKKIEGTYSSSQRGSPEGNARLYITADNHFAIPYFGGVVVGKWHEEQPGLIRFVPYQYPHAFAVWGWYDPELKDSISVYFSQCQDGVNYFGYQSDKLHMPLRQIFNADNNCVPYPNVWTQKGECLSLQLMNKDEQMRSGPDALYTFANDKKYNRFMISFIERKSEQQPFAAQYKEGKLVFDRYQSQFDVKRPLPEAGTEDFAFLKELTRSGSNDIPDTLLLNNGYNVHTTEVIDTLNYRFDQVRNAYVNFLNYKEVEVNEALTDYNNRLLLYPYVRLSFTKRETPADLVLQAQPIFNFTCEGDRGEE